MTVCFSNSGIICLANGKHNHLFYAFLEDFQELSHYFKKRKGFEMIIDEVGKFHHHSLFDILSPRFPEKEQWFSSPTCYFTINNLILFTFAFIYRDQRDK